MVEVEIIGCEYDSNRKGSTKTVRKFSLVWIEMNLDLKDFQEYGFYL